MASIYCPDCNRQAGDNWTECYFCGSKNLKEEEPSPVTSIPKTETTDDVEVSIERVRQLLNKSKFGKVELTKSEKDELSIGFIHYDELSAVEKVKIDREMDEEAIVDKYTFLTTARMFWWLIWIAGISTLFYLMIKF